jgi:hypothetical protein
MVKKGHKLLGAIGVALTLMAASPAQAGWLVAYYYDYVGGTPAGYILYCDNGGVYYQHGVITTYYEYGWAPTPC